MKLRWFPILLASCGAPALPPRADHRPASALFEPVVALPAPAPSPALLELPEPEPEPEPDPGPYSTAPLSKPLSCGLHNPMPGGVVAGYPVDTGLDLAQMPSPVYSIAAGRIVYSEGGHTRWKERHNSPYAVLVELDQPIPFAGRKITHAWYAHLSKLEREVPRGTTKGPRVRAGEKLGVSGTANHVFHLHLGLLFDGVTDQRWGSYLLEDEVRKVLCNARHLSRLPK
jgi:murein DD-endopeptidase MepM/ murein hydrolase activator NlpD